LNLNPLEQRDTPAGGVVTATVVGGSLTLAGDNNANGNYVRILEQGIGIFDIQGQNGTQVKLGTGSPTTSLTVSGVTLDIKGNFFDGPDRFSHTGLFGTPLRDMILSMGKGADTVDLSSGFLDVRNVTVSQGVGDAGNDATTINNPLGNNGGVRGAVSIRNGEGNDTVTLAAKVAGSVTVTNAKGNDTTLIQGASYIGGSVTVLNTTGPVGNDTRVQGTAQISKNLSVTNGDQESINQILGACTVGGSVTIKNGNAFGGTTQNNVNNAVIGGTFVATGTGGQIWTNIDGTRVGKTVTILSGPGNAIDTLTNSTVGGSYISTKGAGNDSLSVQNTTIYGNLALNFGASSSGNTVNIDGLTAVGTTSVITTAGEDRVFIDTSRFIGAVTVNTGAAVDVVEIGQSSGANTFFYGNLTVAAGTGVDQLRVGVNSDIRVSGNTLYSGILNETLTDDFGPFSNIYLGLRKVA